jgi:hypothetical protein
MPPARQPSYRDPTLRVVLPLYLLTVATIVALLVPVLAALDRERPDPVSTTGTVVAVEARRIDVAWTDDRGRRWVSDFRRSPNGEVRVGARVPVRYDRNAPERGAFVGTTPPPATPSPGLTALLVLSLPLTVMWTLRLAGWFRTARRRPERTTVLAHTSVHHGAGAARAVNRDGPLWLHTDDGWWQRVMWRTELVTAGRAGPMENVDARRGRRTIVFDVPGVGRLWPVGRARRNRPTRRHQLVPVPERPPFTTHAAPREVRLTVMIIVFGTTLLLLALGALRVGGPLPLVFGALLLQTCLVVAWTGTPVLAIVQSPRPGPTAAA